MTPQQAIAALDRQLSAHGQDIALRRGNAPQQAIRAFVRGYKPAELVGLVAQGDRNVVLSPSGLGVFGPKAGDDVSIAGKLGKVQDVEEIRIDNVLVRTNLRVRMAG